MFFVITWIVLGALTGWIGSLTIEADLDTKPLFFIVAGISGALIGGIATRHYQDAVSLGNATTGFAVVGAIVAVSLVGFALKE